MYITKVVAQQRICHFTNCGTGTPSEIALDLMKLHWRFYPVMILPYAPLKFSSEAIPNRGGSSFNDEVKFVIAGPYDI